MAPRTIVRQAHQDIDAPPMKLSEKLAKYVIEARCTDNVLYSAALAASIFVIILQTFPIFMNNWVFLTEPRPLNKTNDNGEAIESTFFYNIGYFKICRYYLLNETHRQFTEDELSGKKEENHKNKNLFDYDAEYKCFFNPMLTGGDLTDFSLASLAVIVRLGVPALLHISGATVCCLAFGLGIVGHLRRTVCTMISAICYICGSIVLCTAVLMVVCVVDDELAPRMKPNPAGEPSQFSYFYGYPFFSSALSFLPVQICACFQAFLYFRRYKSVVDKLKYVPGLEAKLRHAQLDKELGIPPVDSFRRGSLASYLPQPTLFIASQRSSRRSSDNSFANHLLCVQEI